MTEKQPRRWVARSDDEDVVGGVHADYLLFTEWRDRIKAGLCKCSREEHASIADADGVVRCSRVVLAHEIMLDMADRYPWGVAILLMDIVALLQEQVYTNQGTFSPHQKVLIELGMLSYEQSIPGMDGDKTAATFLDLMAGVEEAASQS